jgi:2-polyprenyl-3-methyl-5-hydroxy-6-metoxy-1,4-benzoquinol methylase
MSLTSPKKTPQSILCNTIDCQSNIWAQATDKEYFTTQERFTFYHCSNCKIIFIDPVPKDQLSIIYPKNYYSFIDPQKSFVNSIKNWLDKRFFKSILSNITSPSIKVLDVGGGTGWLIDIIKSIDHRVSYSQIVDLDNEAEKIATEKGHHYFCGKIEDFDTPVKFDLVLMLNLIEHVENPQLLLDSVSSILSNNGVAIIKTPNFDSLDARLFRYSNWGGYHCPRHWVLFTKESLTHVASKAGLKVVKSMYTQGAPFWAVSILAWLSDKGVINISHNRPAAFHPLYGPLAGIFATFDFLRSLFSKTSQMFFVLKK